MSISCIVNAEDDLLEVVAGYAETGVQAKGYEQAVLQGLKRLGIRRLLCDEHLLEHSVDALFLCKRLVVSPGLSRGPYGSRSCAALTICLTRACGRTSLGAGARALRRSRIVAMLSNGSGAYHGHKQRIPALLSASPA
jgi:hypothetical protein